MIIENAQIEKTHLGQEDHGIMTIELYLSYDGGSASQAFGGYNLNNDARLGQWIKDIMNVLEVSSWEKIKGEYIRVQKEGKYGKILAIGHLLKDKWFDPSQLKDL